MAQRPDADDPSPPSGNRTVLVTGAARGIGAGTARRLLRDGWPVFGLDRAAGGSAEAAFPRALRDHPRFRPLEGDVSREDDVAAACARIAAEAGSLHGLVSNAGVMARVPLAELSLERWKQVIDTNLTALFLLARAAESMLRKANGAVVAIASTRAHMSEPDTESYAASKGGLVALTHALAVSLGPAIRCNCISPGWIDVSGEPLAPEDHAQHPAGRVGRVEDVAALAAWLLGTESGFVTGAEFVVDGGMTRRMIYRD